MSTQQRAYVSQLQKHLTKWLTRGSRKICDKWVNAALVLAHLDLQPARRILEPLYCPDPRGRKPKDPVAMLRALLLMSLLAIEGFTDWAQTLKSQPRLARIAGFDPDDTPAVGTFYLFIDRLFNGAYQKLY